VTLKGSRSCSKVGKKLEITCMNGIYIDYRDSDLETQLGTVY